MVKSVLTEHQSKRWMENRRNRVEASGAVNTVVHDVNVPLWNKASQMARELGLNIRHNITCEVQWIGFHRYVIFVPGMEYAIHSSGCVHYDETPYSRYYRPSISGETNCIKTLIDWLDEVAKLPLTYA